MAANLLALPYELRERILMPCLRQKGTIEIQYPVWADKAVFTQPLTQACHQLREECIRLFYRENVFVWVIDMDEDGRPDPTMYPLHLNVSRDGGPTGPTLSPLPWYYYQTLSNIRHLRLNLYLPTYQDKSAWETKLPIKLARFVSALDRGEKLKDLRILIGTWYHHAELTESQAAAFDVLEQMQVRGKVHLRTNNIYKSTRDSIRRLDLENRMRCNRPAYLVLSCQPEGNLDWEWEGGVAVDDPAPQHRNSLVGPD